MIIMIRNILGLLTLLLILVSATSVEKRNDLIKDISLPEYVDYNLPYLERNFMAFKEAVAFKESQGKYTAVNTFGYLGKYQFGKTTLLRFKIYNTKAFLNNPELQEKAFKALCKVNKWILRKDIQRCVGKTINGITISTSGILAAAHLSGAGNVKKFLRSNGALNFSDAYGSSIESYLKKFGGYDVSEIEPDRNARI